MMKLIGIILLASVLLLQGQEVRDGALEVRSYRAEVEDFEYFSYSGPGPMRYEGKPIKEAPFESRFFREGDALLEMKPWGVNGGLFSELEAGAIYNLRSRRLVVKASLLDHEALERALRWRFERMVRTEVLLYAVPGVELGMRADGAEGGRLLRSVSCVHLPGQDYEMRSEDGKFEVSGGAQFDANDDLIDSRYTIRSDMEGAQFSVKSGLVAVRGLPQVIEVGSFDGKESLVVSLNQELVLFDGTLLDEWILKEKGGAFLREERLARLGEVKDDGVVEISEGVRGFPVPATFETFLSHQSERDGDPFSTGTVGELGSKGGGFDVTKYPELRMYRDGKLYDATELFRRNGVTFREGDYVVYGAKRSMLFAKATELNLELIEGIAFASTGPGIPRLIRVDFTQVEAAEKVDGKRLEAGEFSLIRKVGGLFLPGQVGSVGLGADLAFEVEAQIDAWDDVVDVRAMLTEDGGDFEKASFKTGVVLAAGKPVVLQQVWKEGKWEAWVVTAEILTVGDGME